MAKRRGEKERVSLSSRRAERDEDTLRVKQMAFRVPQPRGENPGRIPTSRPYRAPVDDEEMRAASPRLSAEEMESAAERRRNRRVSDAALEGAIARRRGNRPMDVERSEQPEDFDETQEVESHDLLKQANEAARGIRGRSTPSQALPQTGQQAQSQQPLTAQVVITHDTDRLWDWIRQDSDQGASFLGQVFPTSLHLHQFMAQMAAAEEKGIAVIRAIYFREDCIGFGMLAPILASEKTALLHIYLRHDVRGQLAKLTPYLLDIVQRLIPDTHLAVASLDAAWAKFHRQLLAPLGFREHVLFVR